MRSLSLWSFVLLISFSTTTTTAATKTLFEGYYKITLSGLHVGYYIQRYELEPKKKQFISTSFLRTNAQGGNISESLKAYSSDKLTPIKYQYTLLEGRSAKTIDANVRKNKRGQEVLQAKVNENGKLRVYETTLKDGSFLSTFLIYLLLQGEKGVTPGANYSFMSIAEEDGKAFPGKVYIDAEMKRSGLDTYKVLYEFKRTQFVNFINKQGESIESVNPALGLAAVLVGDPQAATKGMSFNSKSISLLFGNIPQGTKNEMSRKMNLSDNTKTPALKKQPEKKPATKENDK